MIYARGDTAPAVSQSKVIEGRRRTLSTWLQRVVASLALLSIFLPAVEPERDGILYCGGMQLFTVFCDF